MQARSELGAVAQGDNAVRGNPGPSSFKSKRPLCVIATPDLDLWAQLGPMLEGTVQPRHADSLETAATMLKPGTRTIVAPRAQGRSYSCSTARTTNALTGSAISRAISIAPYCWGALRRIGSRGS